LCAAGVRTAAGGGKERSRSMNARECPKCGYLLTSFERQCPKCAKTGGATVPPGGPAATGRPKLAGPKSEYDRRVIRASRVRFVLTLVVVAAIAGAGYYLWQRYGYLRCGPAEIAKRIEDGNTALIGRKIKWDGTVKQIISASWKETDGSAKAITTGDQPPGEQWAQTSCTLLIDADRGGTFLAIGRETTNMLASGEDGTYKADPTIKAKSSVTAVGKIAKSDQIEPGTMVLKDCIFMPG
jgi:hypothetical protein